MIQVMRKNSIFRGVGANVKHVFFVIPNPLETFTGISKLIKQFPVCSHPLTPTTPKAIQNP